MMSQDTESERIKNENLGALLVTQTALQNTDIASAEMHLTLSNLVGIGDKNNAR